MNNVNNATHPAESPLYRSKAAFGFFQILFFLLFALHKGLVSATKHRRELCFTLSLPLFLPPLPPLLWRVKRIVRHCRLFFFLRRPLVSINIPFELLQQPSQHGPSNYPIESARRRVIRLDPHLALRLVNIAHLGRSSASRLVSAGRSERFLHPITTTLSTRTCSSSTTAKPASLTPGLCVGPELKEACIL